MANNGEKPKAKFSRTKNNILNLYIFGYIAYMHIPKENCQNLDSKTK